MPSPTLGASGAVSSAETGQLFIIEEAMAVIAKANQLQKSHQPPTAA